MMEFALLNIRYLVSTDFLHKLNAALSGEQRHPPNLNHCDVNTKAKSN